MIYSVRYFEEEGYSPVQYIRPYLKAHIFAVFDLRDPKPFIKRCMDMARMLLQRVFSFRTNQIES
jgi:hypothetical protein